MKEKLEKLNSVAEKPGFMPMALGLLGLGISFVASKFSARDMRSTINGEFEKQKQLMLDEKEVLK